MAYNMFYSSFIFFIFESSPCHVSQPLEIFLSWIPNCRHVPPCPVLYIPILAMFVETNIGPDLSYQDTVAHVLPIVYHLLILF